MIIEKKEGGSYIVKNIKSNLLVSMVGVIGLVISMIIQKSNLGLLITVFFIINSVKGLFFVLKPKHSGEELIKAFNANDYIFLRGKTLNEAIDLVSNNLAVDTRSYFLVQFDGIAIFYEDKARWRSFFKQERYYCLELQEKGVKVSTFSIRTPSLFKKLNPEVAIQ